MRAIVVREPGGPEVLSLTEMPDPVPGPGQLLVRVRASALNHADTLQRKGAIGPPPGESAILGVEVAGEIEGWGPGVEGFARGQRVCGLIPGGAYAERCLMGVEMAIPMPEGWSFTDAAAVPEAFLTADETLFALGGLEAGHTVLIHAGGSGVGTAAIQLAHAAGARVCTTAGTEEKLRRCAELGADLTIHYKSRDFVEEVLAFTGGEGVDVVEDFIGGPYLGRNLRVLKPAGRLLQVGVMGGLRGEIDLELVMLRRLQIKGSVLRSRAPEEKRALVERFRRRWLPWLAEGRLRPVVDSVFPFADAAAAHRHMDAHRNFGKIVLDLG